MEPARYPLVADVRIRSITYDADGDVYINVLHRADDLDELAKLQQFVSENFGKSVLFTNNMVDYVCKFSSDKEDGAAFRIYRARSGGAYFAESFLFSEADQDGAD